MEGYCGDELPEEYRDLVVLPVRIERHVDASAHASKVRGFDQDGRRCYYRHEFTLTEERFDADEFALEVGVYQEKVLAWRLSDGKWLKLKTWSDQLDHCRERRFAQSPEITEEAALER